MNEFTSLLAFGIVDGCLLAVATVAFTMQFAVTNIVNFAFGEFITFGAFTAFAVATGPIHLALWEVFLAAGIGTAALSYVIGHFVYSPFFRRRPQVLYGLVLTFAVSLILANVWLGIWGAQFYTLPYFNTSPITYQIGPVALTQLDIVLVAIGVAILGGVHLLLRFTRMGRSMRAMGDDRQLAQICGLRVGRITDATWLITGFLAGLAGVVQALQTRGFDPTLGDTYVYIIFAAAILGGIGRAYGAMVGALIVGIVTQLSVPIIGSADSPVAVFAILVLLMLLRPAGIFGATGRVSFAGEG